MESIFQLIAEVGLPIAGALAMGAFIFIVQTTYGRRTSGEYPQLCFVKV